MPAPRTPEASLDAIIALVEDALRKGYKPPGMPMLHGERGAIRRAAEASGMPEGTFVTRFTRACARRREPDWSLYRPGADAPSPIEQNDIAERRAAAKGLAAFGPEPPAGFEIKTASARLGDGTFVRMGREAGPSYVQPEGMDLRSATYQVDGAGRIERQWLKPSKGPDPAAAARIVRETLEGFDAEAPRVAAPGDTDADLLALYPIPDFHLGMYSWGEETGEDYDVSIASRSLKACVAALIAATPRARDAILLNLGDFLHADDSSNRTKASGHVLDVDTRYDKTLRVGADLLAWTATALLKKHRRVIVRNIPGNHDGTSAGALSVALAAWFRGEKRVSVDRDAGAHFFHRHGATMIAASHGHALKPDKMPGFAAAAQPDMWGATRHRYAFFGHIHHWRKSGDAEIGGMRVESLPALAAKDSYAAGQGYVSTRAMSAIVFGKADGEVSRATVRVRPQTKGA